MPTPDRRRVRVAALTVLLFVAGACGASSEPDSANPGGNGTVTNAPKVRLPDVTVRDVDAATDVPLTGLLPADRPLLLWFWAPH